MLSEMRKREIFDRDNPQAAGPGATTGLLASSDREEGAGKGGVRL